MADKTCENHSSSVADPACPNYPCGMCGTCNDCVRIIKSDPSYAPPIDSFFGQYRFLSNFWLAEVELDGEKYKSVEHAYVAAKTLDLDKRKEIASVDKPGDVKKLGKKLILRDDWDSVKLGIMKDLVRQKFTKEPLKSKYHRLTSLIFRYCIVFLTTFLTNRYKCNQWIITD